MAIKGEFAVKEEDSKLDEDDIRNTPKPKNQFITQVYKKIKKVEDDNKELRKCVKEKDKRIKQIENRWESIQQSIGVTGIIILFSFLALATYVCIVTDFETFQTIMYAIGTCATLFFSCWIAIILMVVVYDDWDAGDMVTSFWIAVGVSFIIGLLILVIVSTSQGGF